MRTLQKETYANLMRQYKALVLNNGCHHLFSKIDEHSVKCEKCQITKQVLIAR
jgi:hypothetical protein